MLIVIKVDAEDPPQADRPEVVKALVGLCTKHEAAIVYGIAPEAAGVSPHRFMAQLRQAMPRFEITAVVTSTDQVNGGRRGPDTDYATLSRLVEEGAVAVAVTSPADAEPLAKALASRLNADRRISVAPGGRLGSS
jgi:hypothetical protein